ncbi:MAG TPA: hypothetical protein DFS52_09910 [Myxococcales bacterium]|jgi:hypothetical protein|nr:hypothetical protein [Myxococcales bacterium]
MARFPVNRLGDKTPPLPCSRCRDLKVMEVVAWEGSACGCVAECMSEGGEGRVRCLECGEDVEVSFSREACGELEAWEANEGPRWILEIWLLEPVSYDLGMQDDAEPCAWVEELGKRLEAEDDARRRQLQRK